MASWGRLEAEEGEALEGIIWTRVRGKVEKRKGFEGVRMYVKPKKRNIMPKREEM